MTRTSQLRVRFAPAPTGMMHLGNVRTALFNYLFAQQKGATFILRIEDTDQQRNYDPQATHIIADLQWLNLQYDQGPQIGGPDAPYFQSERDPIYQQHLEQLQKDNRVYHCFCTPEELEKKRQRQAALKLPPRYDRTCLKLTAEQVQQKLAEKTPFVWRIQLDQSQSVTITDLSHGTIQFELKNFADFPLTRADGKATFIFANFVDDMVMKMTHVIRGEDHLTNTACQAALYKIFNVELPIFWHLPIICNVEGKKLSKRDFGFSLDDLRKAGYLPEAIGNYLAIIGGGSFAQEIMSYDELIRTLNFDAMKSTGHVRYDVEKLRWLNHKWIEKLSPQELAQRCLPFLLASYPQVALVDSNRLATILQIMKSDFHTLADTPIALAFLFVDPSADPKELHHLIPAEQLTKLARLIETHLPLINESQKFVNTLKTAAQDAQISLKYLFTLIRVALIGKTQGPALHDLIDIVGAEKAEERIRKVTGLF
jgi:glutamyl-tRNA synthetase